jgi:hypothetical protein
MKYLPIIILILIASACAMPIEAQFEGPTSELLKKLMLTGEFDDSNITWNANSLNGETIQNLTVELYNGKNMIQPDSTLKVIGKQALQTVLESLKNKNEYNVYSVVFISQQTKGIETTTLSKGFEFSLEELEK